MKDGALALDYAVIYGTIGSYNLKIRKMLAKKPAGEEAAGAS